MSNPINYVLSDDAFNELLGNPNQFNVSADGFRHVKDIVDQNDCGSWLPSEQHKAALLAALSKVAELCETNNIPLSRGLDKDTIIKEEKGTQKGGSYNPHLDEITIKPSQSNKWEDIYEDMLSVLLHEYLHKALSYPIGISAVDDLYQQNQFGAGSIPYQQDDYDDSVQRGTNGYSIIYPQIRDTGVPLYGSGDYGAGYPIEAPSSIITTLVTPEYFKQQRTGNRLIPRSNVDFLNSIIGSMKNRAINETPNIVAEANPRPKVPYSIQQKTQITADVQRAMRTLAFTKELLRNKLAFYQNQTRAIRQINQHPKSSLAFQDKNKILSNNTLLSISTPGFFSEDGTKVFEDNLKYPVHGQPDPFMLKHIQDKFFKDMDKGWGTPSID